jgi:hypothetical protein
VDQRSKTILMYNVYIKISLSQTQQAKKKKKFYFLILKTKFDAFYCRAKVTY